MSLAASYMSEKIVNLKAIVEMFTLCKFLLLKLPYNNFRRVLLL